MNIALIGASGFIGSALLSEALKRGHQVTALVRHAHKIEAQKGLRVQALDIME